jgi:phosphopantothenoylcysteine decarboxylase/phosphopantothenate--cysteine ligase
MNEQLTNKHVVLGVTGSIASYKAVDLASKLTQLGATVDTILTHGATQFVTPLAFRSITHRQVITNLYDLNSEFSNEHIALAQQADIIVIAPATVNCIAKLAMGMADDPLTTTVVATRAPVLIAPAMDGNMYDNPATQQNLRTLQNRGITVVGPDMGHLASGLSGNGRLVEPSRILGHISATLGKNGDLKGKKIVVSAGGTQEPIDPVRVITNHSSGKMGYAIAEAARDRGAEVVLITAPTSLPDPASVIIKRVQTAEQMCNIVMSEVADSDVLIMSAAVADYRPTETADQKIKKSKDDLYINLTKTEDILEKVSGNFIKVGFSAESENLVANASEKIARKSLDLIVANDITDPDSGFGKDTNRVILIDKMMNREQLPVLSKYQVGNKILDKLLPMLSK